jgi:mRNA-degrading endonuclease RelE of RelBE toxin-antitoxin system
MSMEIKPSSKFAHDYKNLPPLLRKRADEQLKILLENPQHPSLGLKKMKGFPDIWEARVTKNYRFTFQTQGNFYLLRRIGTHDILKRH